jgi:ATP-dependent DNA helicase RecG
MPDKLPFHLDDLLRQRTVEGERIEYKAGWNPDPIIRTLCAFANDFENLGGGYVVIGQDCDDNGRPIFPPAGLAENQLDKIQRELLAACQSIQPPYFPALSIHEVEGRKVIVLQAPGGMHRPYKAPASVTAKHKTWHYYIRRYTSTVEAKGEAELELLSLTAQVPWDDRYNQHARVSDLSTPLMLDYLREVGSGLAEDGAAMSIEELGRQMNLVGGPQESPWPKNVGLLFFNEAPERFFPYTQIDVVWFPEGARRPLRREDFQGAACANDARCPELHSAQLPDRDCGQAPGSGRGYAGVELPLCGSGRGAGQRRLPPFV